MSDETIELHIQFQYGTIFSLVILLKFFSFSLTFQSYTTNSAKVVFLHERPHPKNNSFRGSGNFCTTCDRSLQDPYQFCSLSCKVLQFSFWVFFLYWFSFTWWKCCVCFTDQPPGENSGGFNLRPPVRVQLHGVAGDWLRRRSDDPWHGAWTGWFSPNFVWFRRVWWCGGGLHGGTGLHRHHWGREEEENQLFHFQAAVPSGVLAGVGNGWNLGGADEPEERESSEGPTVLEMKKISKKEKLLVFYNFIIKLLITYILNIIRKFRSWVMGGY